MPCTVAWRHKGNPNHDDIDISDSRDSPTYFLVALLPLQWMALNHIEFVAHLAHHRVPLPNATACNFDIAPFCTAAALDSALALAKTQANVTHLMGWNEAYDKGNSKAQKKYITPTDAATWWRVYVQGMAARAGLALVSPTTGVETHKLEWMGDMLLACWDQRDLNRVHHVGPSCDVETITAFSVHDYKCSEEYWRENYGERGTFQKELAKYLAKGSTSRDQAAAKRAMNWTAYVETRPIWVTETNCNGDTGFPPTAAVSGTEQCARITGQRAAAACGSYGKCGIGSIAAMESMSTVARVSWWNTHQNNYGHDVKTANAMLVNSSGGLYPPGRALASGLSPTTDCIDSGVVPVP